MIAHLRTIHRRRVDPRRRDRGFTLVELLIALVLSGIIAGAVIAALATSLNVASSTTKLVADSTDAGQIAAFLYRDAQAAGASETSTTQPNASLGVSTSATAAGWSDCTQPGSSLVVRFSWLDAVSASSHLRNVVTYALDAAHHLTRRFCPTGATASEVILGQAITSAVATCEPDQTCGTGTSVVALALIGAEAQTPFAYTLRASLRTDQQSQPSSANSSAVPLLALSAAADSVPCPVLTAAGARQVTVLGDVVAGSNCDPSPIKVTDNLLQQSGTMRSIRDVTDPFFGTVPPATTCGEGTNPSPVGDSSDPSTPVLYPTAVTITGTVVFKPGRYVFCDGLTFGANATITGSDVFLFVPGGNFTVADTATVNLSAATTGTYANLLVWVSTTQQVSLGSGANASTYAGYVYAPTSQVNVSGAGPTNIGGIIGRGVRFDGSSRARIGLPVPSLAVAPSMLPAGQMGLAYTPTTLTAAGGTAPYTWSATPLPDGIALDPATGVLSGSPTGTMASSTNVVVTVFDSTSAAFSTTYTLALNAMLAVDPASALSDGQVGVSYPLATIAATGGTAPFTYSATGLPPGIGINPTTGVVSGSPTTPGAYSAIVSITDAAMATATKTFPLTIRAMLGVNALALPTGQVGVGYGPTASTTFTTSGGLAPYTWSATGLPPGLTLDELTGTVAGTPTIAGSYTVVVTSIDAAGATATSSAALTINAALGVGTTSLPGGQVGVVYPPTALTPTGGTEPYTWSATGLPAGLTLDAGAISGTPTESGTFTIEVTVIDATATSSTESYSVTIVPMLEVNGPVALPAGQVGVVYATTTVSQSGGTRPFSWSATGLPAGLAMDPATGVISGTPTAAGSFSVGVLVTDAASATAARIYPLTIRAPLAVTPQTMPPGKAGVAYSATTFAATGGLAPYSWSAAGLPAGLSINASTGAITGTPTATGSYTVVVTATDAATARATTSSPLTVTTSVPAGCPLNPSGWRGEYFSNISLTGTAYLCRDDAAIDFDWGSGRPLPAPFPNTNFSVRWTRTQNFAADTYTFTMGSDDGARLYIDGVLVLDDWSDRSYPTPQPTVVRSLTAGSHTIVMEYYEHAGVAAARLGWASGDPSACPTTVNGWKGEYFANISLTAPAKLCRDDAGINFDWGGGAPAATLPADNFSVRWTRTQTFTAGTYTFVLGTDDGTKLFVDGVLELDVWRDQPYPSSPPSVKVKLAAGPHTIVVEYYEHAGVARATLSW